MKFLFWIKLFFWGVFFIAMMPVCSVFGEDAKPSIRTFRTNTVLQVKPFKPVTAVMIKKSIKLKTSLRPLVPSSPVKPTGPDPEAAIDLSDMIDDAALLEDLAVVCGWDPHLIFQDKTAGNVFYYLPRAFLLVHDQGTGFGLNVQYNHLKEDNTPSVMLTAQLAAPHHPGDILLLKSILKQAFDLKPADTLTLKSISGIGATADIQSITAGLSLPPERVSVVLPSHLKQSFRLILSLNQDETEEVLAQIAREGLSGTLNVKVGESFVPVPMVLKYFDFAGDRVDGFSQWVENRPAGTLQNITPFPVKIESVNCYKVNNGQLERITKNLKPSILEPGKKKDFKLPSVSQLLGNNVMLAWLATSLDSGCQDCIKQVDKQVRKGVSTALSTSIKFEAIPAVFSDFEMYKMIVQVQSPYFSAEPGAVATKEIELTEDANINQDLVIYPPGGKGGQPLLYRYRIKLVMSDGNALIEEGWQDSQTTSQFFGTSQIEPIIGEKPEDTPDDIREEE
ncbi:MAG: hypothetical protein KKE62_10565 [Proteobacteria bacterium]|nr:hypothetical protein [Pseudomonadota bacterium]MBU1386658.1 hypothetical protein [Pseudomonadota bacterium]MBU1543269.1 hypothetical protein [Pseudomonadota bacterium]MBU2429743.1 hypothetical protein [Pseudomonadota bacterium]MBU2482181.1 hypothetical protein [Pseudomonadota bacterium]